MCLRKIIRNASSWLSSVTRTVGQHIGQLWIMQWRPDSVGKYVCLLNWCWGCWLIVCLPNWLSHSPTIDLDPLCRLSAFLTSTESSRTTSLFFFGEVTVSEKVCTWQTLFTCLLFLIPLCERQMAGKWWWHHAMRHLCSLAENPTVCTPNWNASKSQWSPPFNCGKCWI